MKLSEMLSEDLILTDLKARDVPGVLGEFAEALQRTGRISDSKELFERLYEREKQGSTGIGKGVAIPHCKSDSLQQVVLSVGYSRDGVQFSALDGGLTYFFFLLVSPTNSSVMHLRALAALSRLLKSPGFLSQLQQHPAEADLISLIRKEEETALVK